MKSSVKTRTDPHSAFPLFFACIVGMAIPGGLAEARSLAEIKQSGEVRICLVAVERFHCRAEAVPGELQVRRRSLRHGHGFLAIPWGRCESQDLAGGLGRAVLQQGRQTVREDSYTPELMASGKCDVYSTGLTKLPWREKKLAFVTLYPTRMVVVVNKSRKEEFKTPGTCARRRRPPSKTLPGTRGCKRKTKRLAQPIRFR